MGEWRGVGASRYAGLRTTITMHPGKNLLLASTSSKSPRGGWDEWTRLAPVTRLEMDHPPTTTEEALWCLHEATYLAWLGLVDPRD